MALASSALLQQELSNPPVDGITQTIFAHTSDLLLASSWDKTVRLYDAPRNSLRGVYEHKSAVLDVCFTADDTHAIAATLDNQLLYIDLNRLSEKKTTNSASSSSASASSSSSSSSSYTAPVMGSHGAGVKCVLWCPALNCALSGGWDGQVQVWDPRVSGARATATPLEGHKIYTMDAVQQRLVVGTSGQQVVIYDVRKWGEPEQRRESSLTNQTRCIRCFPDGQGYALSSIEGRVAIEYFDPSPEVQKKKYAFRCHRKTEGNVQVLYPVNAIAFHPRYGTFATGGCDGYVNIWDGLNKKRIYLSQAYQTSIANLNFNSTGSLLAIAASYTWEEGEKEHPADSIYIRTVNESEVMPKLRQAAK